MRKILLSITAILWVTFSFAQTKPLTELTVEEIMQDQAKFVGTSPSNVSWSKDSKNIFFTWRNKDEESSSTFKVGKSGGELTKDDDRSEGWPSRYVYNKDESKIIYVKGGDIYMMELKGKKETQITGTNVRESNPQFHTDDIVTYIADNNLFSVNLKTGLMRQLTNFTISSNDDGPSRSRASNGNSGNKDQDAWLRKDQLETSAILKERRNRPRNRNRFRGATFGNQVQAAADRRDRVELDNVRNLQLSPDGKFVSFSVYKAPKNPAKNTIVPNYVTTTGYTTDLRARSKVGGEQGHSEIGIYSVEGDSLYMVDVEKLPGITDLPDYVKDYPDRKVEKKPRQVSANNIIWSENGKYAVVNFDSRDNKDRWIMQLMPASGELKTIDRQRDEAWIAGPGISSFAVGFLPDSETLYFQSERSGYSHLYIYDFKTGTQKQLTDGNYEVYNPRVSKDGSKWYFTANMKHPGIRHFYSMPIKGGKITQITSEDGNNNVSLSPDEKTLAVLYSYIDKPTELYVQPNKPGAKWTKITDSQQEGFKQYDWHEAEIITFKAEDGADVHARLYKPENPNGAGVIFVHGAGYLQNVHYWWSSYQREYMFNNMLMAKGYTVLDIDYRASSGYGRDWRTGIYRHMGGKDLSDQIDGAKYLMEEHNVEAGRIGMYGGSYGGFITLFAMFQHPDIINSGAALRSVTDWAHYNHGYTSNILNTPIEDPIAYKRSSPIYFAEGLKGDLLIAHGMVDTNVHFQDVVRLAQRLIELGKDNWEMALYPVENHGFTTPSSWTDEYKRIYKLFDRTIGKK
ncbi:S9 family peptidase [Roseivirga misakiensis]|uniref:Peptidase S9 n=1 Tax=Roseivirga misakiensis TaxID=1563681 RepID=A0A1E5SYY4_9BACT|nr:S9 family peptidase [Roseivirga misakiensis]OEK04330.1 peptidase S9 [Roseivirga misakiensis]